MHEVTITGLARSAKATPNKAGYRILAFFDCEVEGFGLRGCAFVRTPRNGLTVWPPKLAGPNAERCGVEIKSEQLRKALVRFAQDAYRALGGTDGEWMPHDDAADQRRSANYAAAGRRIEIRNSKSDKSEGLNRFLNNGAE